MKEVNPKIKERIEMSPLRKIIAERMVESLSSMAQVTLMREANVNGLVEFKKSVGKDLEEKHGVKVSYTDIIVKAVASTIKRHPLLNSTLKGEYIEVFEDVNIGVAVAIDHGLVVPVVKNADRKSLVEISREIKSLADKARKGMLTLEDVEGGTFTVSNLGMYGVDCFTPIINPPQTAILGVGRIVEKPAFHEGKVVPVNSMWLSLTFDHRVIDGHTAALFLQELSNKLESLDSLKELVL